jgi:hypothetical protein
MNEQERDFQAAFGEVMFNAYLIEDLIALHVYECSCINLNGYEGITREKIEKMSHKRRIDQLLVIYGDQDRIDGSFTRLASALHHLREIRNHLTHEFILQVGNDFMRAEGVDQILAMLSNISFWERSWLDVLHQLHEAVLSLALANFPIGIENREDPPFDSSVSKSEIQQHLDDLKKLMKG